MIKQHKSSSEKCCPVQSFTGFERFLFDLLSVRVLSLLALHRSCFFVKQQTVSLNFPTIIPKTEASKRHSRQQTSISVYNSKRKRLRGRRQPSKFQAFIHRIHNNNNRFLNKLTHLLPCGNRFLTPPTKEPRQRRYTLLHCRIRKPPPASQPLRRRKPAQ